MTIDLNNIFPIIKEQYSDNNPTPSDFKGQTVKVPSGQEPIFRPLVHNLNTAYVIDKGDRFEYLKNEILNDELTKDRIHEIALQNLEKRLDNKINYITHEDHILFVTADRNFESSIVLLDFVWPQIEEQLKDSIIISIPHRQMLLVSAEHSVIGNEKIRRMTKDIYLKHQVGRTSKDLFKMKNGQLEFFETTI